MMRSRVRRRIGQVFAGLVLLMSTAAAAGSLYPPLVVTGFSPDAGPAGMVITVQGRGLDAVDAAWLGAAHDAAVKRVSATELQVTVPPDAAPGADSLAVAGPTGLSFARRRFTVLSTGAPKPVVSIEFTPATIALGATASLSWSSGNASSCIASGAWHGSQGTSGSLSVSPRALGRFLYTLTCTGGGGASSVGASLTVTPASTLPVVTVSVNPSSVVLGGSATLSWSSTNATSCTASGAWSGSQGTSGSTIVSPVAAGTDTYVLTCSGAGGTGSDSAMLTVTAPPKPVVVVSLNPTSIVSGGSSTLTWSSSNATSCTASGAWSGSQPVGGNTSVSPAATGMDTYSLTCSGAGGTGSGSATLTVTAAPVFALKVNGNRLVDGAGHTLQLRGANISGLESTAIQGWDPGNPWGDSGFTGEPQWSTLLTWGINTVRLPLNEASWLGLTTYDHDGTPRQADPGRNYQATVIKSVQDATASGLYVILDLHWSGPNVAIAGQAAPVPQTPFEADGGQNPMADADHSVAFWTSVANSFKSNPAVAFELYNEPYFYWITGTEAAWGVLRNGGTITQYVTGGTPYQVAYDWQAAGMQQLLTAVRATGATNVVIAGGVDWCGDMQNWLAYGPTDPLNQLAASWHAYPLSDTVGDPNATIPTDGTVEYGYVQTIAAMVPVVITETGDHSAAGTIGSPFDSIVLPWADNNGVSYLGWTWDPWGASDDDLIQDASGTPTDGFGQYFRAHLVCRAQGNAVCP